MTQEQIEQGSIEKLGRLSPAFCVGAEWAEKKTIDKACDFIRNNIDKTLVIYHNETWCSLDEFISKLRKALEQ